MATFSRSLAREVATEGITVNCVAPGTILTPSMTRWAAANPEAAKAVMEATPMHRLGKPEEIAHMIVFLASDEAAFITGQNYSVDGGKEW